MNKTRAKAWKTRRKLYGARGHNGSYARTCARCRRMITMLVRLHVDGVLSEGQVAGATGLHRVDVRKVADEITSSRETGFRRERIRRGRRRGIDQGRSPNRRPAARNPYCRTTH